MTARLIDQLARARQQMAVLEAKVKVLERKVANQKRQELTRLKVVIGQAILPILYENAGSRERLYKHLDDTLRRQHDRAVFLARYPRGAEERISTPQQQRRMGNEIAKLDWRLMILIGAALLNLAAENASYAKEVREYLDTEVTGKRDRAIIDKHFDAATTPKA